MRGLRGGGCQRSLPSEITLKNRPRPPVPPLVKTISHNNLPRDFKSAHVQDQKMNFKDYAFLQYSSVVFVFCFDMRGTPVFDLTLVQIQSFSYILSRVVLRTLWKEIAYYHTSRLFTYIPSVIDFLRRQPDQRDVNMLFSPNVIILVFLLNITIQFLFQEL